jgi:hypothetical protein
MAAKESISESFDSFASKMARLGQYALIGLCRNGIGSGYNSIAFYQEICLKQLYHRVFFKKYERL